MYREIKWIYCLRLFIIYSFLACSSTGSLNSDSKIYAIYFPQFHDDPLNTEIWGPGYSDWKNLQSAPLLNRKNQLILRPHPDIGYYDLATTAARRKQAEIAKEYHVDGFIYYHYWFYHDTELRVLSKPLEEMLKDHEPNVSFAFSWAAQSWRRTWQGNGATVAEKNGTHFHHNPMDPELLWEQRCPHDNMTAIEEHYQYLRTFFHHPNYIKVDGMPMFQWFRYSWSWECRFILPKLKELAKKDGFPKDGLYIVGSDANMVNHELINGNYTHDYSSPPNWFFNSYLYFPVDLSTDMMPAMHIPPSCLSKKKENVSPEIWQKNNYPYYLGVMTQFDNTPRRAFDKATLLSRHFPHLTEVESFELDLIHVLFYDKCCFAPEVKAKGGNFIVIAAWNEWGEGMVLEPSVQQGYSYLRSVRRIKKRVNHASCDWKSYKRLTHSYYE